MVSVCTVENILEICEVLLENMEGMMKFSRDMSSSRLFCKGVPVNNNLCSACRHKSKFITKILFDISSKEHLKCECLVLTTKQTVCTDIDGHEVAVAQRVHIFKHVALIKYGILQLHLPEETAVIIISNCDVVPNTRKTSKC